MRGHLTQDTFRGIRCSFPIGHVTLWTSEAFALSFHWLVCVDRTRKTFSNILCDNTIMTRWTDNLVIYKKIKALVFLAKLFRERRQLWLFSILKRSKSENIVFFFLFF